MTFERCRGHVPLAVGAARGPARHTVSLQLLPHYAHAQIGYRTSAASGSSAIASRLLRIVAFGAAKGWVRPLCSAGGEQLVRGALDALSARGRASSKLSHDHMDMDMDMEDHGHVARERTDVVIDRRYAPPCMI